MSRISVVAVVITAAFHFAPTTGIGMVSAAKERSKQSMTRLMARADGKGLVDFVKDKADGKGLVNDVKGEADGKGLVDGVKGEAVNGGKGDLKGSVQTYAAKKSNVIDENSLPKLFSLPNIDSMLEQSESARRVALHKAWSDVEVVSMTQGQLRLNSSSMAQGVDIPFETINNMLAKDSTGGKVKKKGTLANGAIPFEIVTAAGSGVEFVRFQHKNCLGRWVHLIEGSPKMAVAAKGDGVDHLGKGGDAGSVSCTPLMQKQVMFASAIMPWMGEQSCHGDAFYGETCKPKIQNAMPSWMRLMDYNSNWEPDTRAGFDGKVLCEKEGISMKHYLSKHAYTFLVPSASSVRSGLTIPNSQFPYFSGKCALPKSPEASGEAKSCPITSQMVIMKGNGPSATAEDHTNDPVWKSKYVDCIVGEDMKLAISLLLSGKVKDIKKKAGIQ